MAMTYTPSIGYTADGQEVPNFDTGTFETSAFKQAVSDYQQDNEFADFYYDNDGNVHHRYGHLDPDIYQTFEEDYQEQVYSTDLFDGRITAEDAAYLTDLVGGEGAKVALLDWAHFNLNPQDLAEYDAAVSTGDVEQMEAWITWLQETAWENGFDPQLYADEFEVEEDDEYDEYLAATDEFVSSALEHYGSDYTDATFWAYHNLPDEMIAQYDYCMDEAPFDVRQAMVNQLMGMYYQAQQDDDYYNDNPQPAHSNFY
jgi:hypothetical protein